MSARLIEGEEEGGREGESWWLDISEEWTKVLGTARIVMESRWLRSAATEVVDSRELKSEKSGYEDKIGEMLMAKIDM